MFELDTLRLIKKTFKRFLSLTLIVMIGAGFMMGLLSTAIVMRQSADEYSDEYNVEDMMIYSSYGFCTEDYEKLSNLDYVDTVFASKEIDCQAIDKHEGITISRVTELTRKNDNYYISEGRMPEKADECLVITGTMRSSLSVGDTLALNYGDNDINDYLTVSHYTVVGVAKSPQYMSRLLGASNYKNEDLEAIIFVPNVNFISDYYTTMYITIDGAKELLLDGKEYDNYISGIKTSLKEFSSKQETYFRDKLIEEASDKIAEKEELLEQSRQAGQEQLDKAKQELDEANVQIIVYEAQLNALEGVVKSLQTTLSSSYDFLEDSYIIVKDTEGYINSILDKFGIKPSTITSGTMEYIYHEYNSAISQYNSLKGQLNSAKAQYQSGLKEYEEALVKFNTEIESAEEELKLAKAKLNDLPKSEWMILDRDTQYATLMFKSNCDQMEKIGLYLPIMFFLVAALVCVTTMKRLIDEQRGQIGIYAALGFSNSQIIGKYVTYAFLASMVGGVIGIAIGGYLFPYVLYTTWQTMVYFLPDMKVLYPIKNILISLGSFTILMCSITAYVTNNVIKDMPSNLMRPVAPKNGKEILLEKIPFIWNGLSFTSKITARNIFRYKSRFLMTIFGIAGCTGLLILGFGIKDSINDVITIQNSEIIKYDYVVNFEDSKSIDNAIEVLSKDSRINNLAPFNTYTTRVFIEDSEATAAMTVIEPSDALLVYGLRETDKKTPIVIDNTGIIVSEKFAQNNNIKEGDYITIESKDRIKGEARVSKICEMYYSHYIFMSKTAYENIFDSEIENNKLAVMVETDEKLNEVFESLDGYVSHASMNDMAKAANSIISALNLIIVVIILVAGLLAFVVITNLTQVNISERVREIATLKVLGFIDQEVYAYIFKEIILLSLIGCVIGIPIGIVEHKFIMGVLNIEIILYGDRIALVSYIYSILITIVFTFIVLMFMRRHLRNVDMVESLKSVE